MSMRFGYSIRALHTDREWPMLVILIIAIVLLGLWMIWFFGAPIARYQTGAVVAANRGGALIARFPDQAQADLLPGQLAQVHQPVNENNEATVLSFPAMVMSIEAVKGGGQLAVTLAPLTDHWFGKRQVADAVSPIVVEVEVEQLSPAQWIWRASGQWINKPVTLLVPPSRP